jgi:hypothetical protein
LTEGFQLLYTNGESFTQIDPRLGPLPSGWRMHFGESGEGGHDDEVRSDGTIRPMYFKNLKTKEETEMDPRMTSVALIGRGVNIQDFIVF